MSTTYPAQIDTNQSLPTVVDNLTPVQGKVFNQLRDAVIAIESTLGAQANGIYSSVGSRLSVLENTLGNLQIISLAQDIGGTLGSPLVVGLQGHPVSDAFPPTNTVLTWNGIAWVPLPPMGLIDVTLGCDLAGDKLCQIVVGLQGNPLAATAPIPGSILQWSGTEWVPGPLTTPSAGEILSWSGTAWVAGFSPPGPSNLNIKQMVAGNFTTNANTPVRIGASDIDMSGYPATIVPLTRNVHFKALIEVTTVTATAQIQLVDVTNNVVITGTIGSTSSATGLVLFDSGPLTVGTSNGDIRTDMVAIYEVQLTMTAGNPVTDRAICSNARVEVTYS